MQLRLTLVSPPTKYRKSGSSPVRTRVQGASHSSSAAMAAQ